jgi:hypothetical protein
MHLPKIGPEGRALLGSHHIADVVMPMLGLAAFGTGGYTVAVDVDGQTGGLMPGIDHKPLHSGLLHGFA